MNLNIKTVRTLVICNFLLLSACSYPQGDVHDESVSTIDAAELTSFVDDGKFISISEMSSLFEKDTTLKEVVISNSEQLKKALRLNLEYLQKKGSGSASPQRSLYYNYKNLRTINELLQKNESDTLDVSNLQLQQIWGSDKMGNVQFTSYYIPVIEVRREKDSVFKYPIYKKPASSYLARLSREQIDEKNMLSGKNLELAYAKNYFDVFSMQVQGSGYVEFEGGDRKLFSYGGKNNRAYTSIGRYLIDQEHISKADISMQSIKAWFEENPDSTSILMKNASYVYFQESFKEPSGAAGVPLIDFVSIASDFRYLPKGSILLGQVPILDAKGVFVKHEYRILIVHDTGGAIKGAGHVDLYAGVGTDAGEYAGRMKHYGRLWLILP
ncbi:MAG: murein transglycosylase A [Crocinitomicaceae bacterium]|nr:murein transglycosylase A [Crocinitomicaceae bacterium]